jgi:pyrroline-5-carboxylate reductase
VPGKKDKKGKNKIAIGFAVGFVGGGNMAEALIAALLKKKVYKAAQIGVYEPEPEKRKKLAKKYKIAVFDSNKKLASASSTLLLAVKPQQMSEVLEEIALSLKKEALLISIAAGLDTDYFFKRLPKKTRLIRVMPNVCAMIGEGATAIFSSSSSQPKDRALAMKIFSAAGKAVFVSSEEMLDVVTALSGSGPAFIFLFIEALIEAGEKLGLPEAVAKPLILQTFFGGAKMAETTQESIPDLIGKVTSKGGTTAAGLKILVERHFKELILETITAAVHRAKELRQLS